MRKVALITGAVRNSGLAIARRFAKEGYDICVTSRKAIDAERTADELSKEFGVAAVGCGLDLQNVEDIRRVFAVVDKSFGRLDVFVGNSADLGVGQTVLEITPEEFDSVMNVNIRGNFFCCQEAAKLMMRNHSGAIVLIGSVHYRGAVYGRIAYAASKGAVASMVHNLAFELAEHGIRVNQVVPGAIRTDRWNDTTPEQAAKRRENWPLGIESTGDDIANSVYFMASDQAKTITGTELVVDSGTLACVLTYNGGRH